jgi:hypothetical protein
VERDGRDAECAGCVDVAALGLKFGDWRTLIERLQTLIDHINLIYRRSSFAFDLLDKQITTT